MPIRVGDFTRFSNPRQLMAYFGLVQAPQQPDDFNVTIAFGLKPAARPHPVEIAVDIELQEIAGRVAGTARRLRLDPLETGGLQIKPIDEGVDEADGVVDADVIVNRLGQKQELRAIGPTSNWCIIL